MDSGDGDAAMDAVADASMADADAAIAPRVGTCEACLTDAGCQVGSFCATLGAGAKACLPLCDPRIPSCAPGFACVVDFTLGVDAALCSPQGGACCLDIDADTYGQGLGCAGADCDDDDSAVNPAMEEICDGVDNDCDSSVDEGGTDCSTGRCMAQGDGTYAALEGASCVEARCVSGTLTACGAYACSEGGEEGVACATRCSDAAGADDDGLCADAAHCDAGICLPDEPNGGLCDEDSDCSSVHCDGGSCCTSGSCCATDLDCSGVAASCTDAAACQGERGDASCVENTCTVLLGVADDTACDGGTMALRCGLFLPIFCSGAAEQRAPTCPTTCTLDSECVSDAHCEGGACVLDRGAGGLCSRDGHCSTGLSCADAVCCTTPCDGSCEYCD
ncbi:MAG: MopE-related protein, partial [Myxococcales bacterium]|nr:MopE-related protein [Myxococcales bacterium]